MAKKRKSKTKNNKIKKVRRLKKESIPESSEFQVERVLVQNFVSLQRVMTNLSSRFDDLTVQISKLLELFEISAKALAEKDFDITGNKKEDNKEMISKMDNLLEQNKVIARGLTLLNRAISPQSNASPMVPENTSRMLRPPTAPPNSSIDMGEYQKSIATTKEDDSIESSLSSNKSNTI